MSDIYGLETTQIGHNRSDGDRYLSFSSRFDTLKIKQQGTAQLTNSSRTITIPHNLGYKPFFMVHCQGDPAYAADYGNYQDYFMAPLYSADGHYVIAWADTTNIYIKAGPKFGIVENYYYHYDNYDACFESQNYGHFVGYGAFVGHHDATWGNLDGALRFRFIAETQQATKAEIGFKIATSRNGTVAVRTYGIDEDNTSDFGGNPFGRSRTDANVQNSCDNGITDIWAYEITNIYNEIISRGGWSSNNSMGFLLYNDGNTGTKNIASSLDYQGSYLKVTRLLSETLANLRYTIYYNKIDA